MFIHISYIKEGKICICFASNQYRADGTEMQDKQNELLTSAEAENTVVAQRPEWLFKNHPRVYEEYTN